MTNSPNLLEPLPLSPFVLHRNVKVGHFSDKMKTLHNDPSKIFTKPTEVTYDFLTQDVKTFHPRRNHWIPYYPKKPLLFPHIQPYDEQKSEKFHDSDTSHMIQNNL